MLNNISWQGYWTVLALFLTGYYLIIYLLYYRRDFSVSVSRALSRNNSSSETVPFHPSSSTTQASIAHESQEYLFDSCLNELAAFFDQAKSRKWMKEELLYALQRIFKKYSELRNSEYEDSLRKLVICQAVDICSVQFEEVEVDHVWL